MKIRTVQCLVSFLFITGFLFLVGCGASNPHASGTYERGMLFVEQEKYPEAISALEAFVRHNPTDEKAAEAQYQKALTYLNMEEYPLAVVEFQIMVKDYPTSSRIEDAMFQEGLAYYKQVGKVERDITGAYEARLHFLKFSQTYPQSEHMDEIISTMRDISDLMVMKRLQQVHVFRQLKRYEAVVMTLGIVLEEEANSRLLDRVMWERGQGAEKLGDYDTAEEMYQRLVQDFPESVFRQDALKAIKDLEEIQANEED
ncbi:MAG: outer membrane protein assembly factor BamD [bacterium]|nr:outer membrane protein assembly factor BamD [bacterium]